MKLLMLGWELPPHNSGGLGVACLHMAKALARIGADIDFVLPYQAEHPDTEWMRIHAAIKVDPAQRGESALAYSQCYDEIRQVQAGYIGYVEELVMRDKPEVIHAHDWLTMQAGVRAKELSGAPLVVHVHATEFDRSGMEGGNPLIHEIEYQGLMMADRILAVSGITKQLIIDRYAIPADKIDVVHNAVDLEKLHDYYYDRRTYSYLEHLRDEGYAVVSVVTRFTIQKGLTHFIRAAAATISSYSCLRAMANSATN